MSTPNIENIEVDTSQAEAELQRLQMLADTTLDYALGVARKGYVSLNALAVVMGESIPIWFNLMFTAVMMAARTYQQLGEAARIAALAGGPISPWLAAQAAFDFLSASMLFLQATLILRTGSEASREITKLLAVIGPWVGGPR